MTGLSREMMSREQKPCPYRPRLLGFVNLAQVPWCGSQGSVERGEVILYALLRPEQPSDTAKGQLQGGSMGR